MTTNVAATTQSGHHRINEQLEEYWKGLRAGRPMPFEHEVREEDLAEIWEHCFLVAVHPDRFAYSHLGSQIIEAYGDDFTGREIAETLLEPHPKSLFSKFREVAERGQPTIDESEFTNSRGQLIKYRACILPLTARGYDRVAYLLGGMKWKAY